MRSLLFISAVVLASCLTPDVCCAQEVTEVAIASTSGQERPLGSPLFLLVNQPRYQGGELTSDQGMILIMSGLSVQAQRVRYVDRSQQPQPVHRIEMSGELMVRYRGRIYTADRFEYDFLQKEGVLFNGLTQVENFFIGAETVKLVPLQPIVMNHSFVTTSDVGDIDWKVQAKQILIDQEMKVRAERVVFKLYGMPLFLLPHLAVDLRGEGPSIVYGVDWERGSGPRLSFGYPIYLTGRRSLFAHLYLRPMKGVGVAVETNLYAHDRRICVSTRSYVDHDLFYRDQDPDRVRTHYRFQGNLKGRSHDERGECELNYDYISDFNLQKALPDRSFIYEESEPTFFSARRRLPTGLVGVGANIQLNPFDGGKERLPELLLTRRPFVSRSSGVVASHEVKVGFLRYHFPHAIEEDLPNFQSARLTTHSRFVRPIQLGMLSVAPSVDLLLRAYTDGQTGRALLQGVVGYNCFVQTDWVGYYRSCYHRLRPYLHYRGLTYPTAPVDTPYIFDISDGLDRLGQLRSGLYQEWVWPQLQVGRQDCASPILIWDLYSYTFFSTQSLYKSIPKLGQELKLELPYTLISTDLRWNVEQQRLDKSVLALGWTFNPRCALHMEWRYRGPFYYRKMVEDNFVMEVARAAQELRASPLSDRRQTFLARLQLQLTPRTVARVEGYLGWGRSGEPPYQLGRLELITLIASSWRLRLDLTYSQAPQSHDLQFSARFDLLTQRF